MFDLIRSVFLGTLVLILCTPFVTFAATSSQPSCTLSATSESNRAQKGNHIIAAKGETVRLTWTSKNTISTTDTDGFTVPNIGTTKVSPVIATIYAYTFRNGSKIAVCRVQVDVVSATVNPSSLNTPVSKPTLFGLASSTKTVRVTIESKKKILYKSSEIRVKNGAWAVTSNKKLPNGTYTVSVFGSKSMNVGLIATSTLVIGPKSVPQITVTPIPLLFGGPAHTNTSVPVAYIQIRNTGSASAKIKGFTLLQKGTTPTSAIIGFSTSDDKGGSRSVLGGAEGKNPFKDEKNVFVPLETTIPSGQMRIFTIKATLGSDALKKIGTTVMMDTISISTDATITGTFPIKGTTWTIIL